MCSKLSKRFLPASRHKSESFRWCCSGKSHSKNLRLSTLFERVSQVSIKTHIRPGRTIQNTLPYYFSIPQQKYVISLSNKKVYDITERKNFCSGDCYKASNFVKEQMLTSPLWLRDQEDIPEFRLLNTPSQASLSVQTTTTTVTKIEISQEPTVEINIDELRIVEKTYPASSSKGDQNDGGRRSIQEGSEVDLSIRESESSGNSNEADEKDSLSDCIKKCLWKMTEHYILFYHKNTIVLFTNLC